MTARPQPISGAPVTLPGSNVVFTGQKARRPYPQLVANVMMQPDGSMHYDSLQTKVERRFADGWALSSGYTWSKAMGLNFNGNWLDTQSGGRWYERDQLSGPMQYDRAHTFYASFLWETAVLQELERNNPGDPGRLGGRQHHDPDVGPDFPGQHRDRHSRSRVRAITRGRIGSRTARCRRANARWTGSLTPRPSPARVRVVPECHSDCIELRSGQLVLRPLRGAAVPLVDFSLHKQFRIREGQSFDFRVDMFNAFNHPIFQLPNGSMATANGGRVTDTSAPRQIMFGFRYSF